MKIFSNFDTELPRKLLKEAKKKYGAENVCFVRRDSIYMWLKVYIPLLARFIFSLIVLIIVYGFFETPFARWIGWISIIVLALVVKYKALNKVVDYYLDFAIITPNHITAYDQDGIFKRSTRSLDIHKIKSINIIKKGALASMFNFGSIVFFSEGDEALGDITLNYINNPVTLKNKINAIVNKYRNQHHDQHHEVVSK